MFIIAAAQSQVVKLCSTQTSIIVTIIGNEMRHCTLLYNVIIHEYTVQLCSGTQASITITAHVR